MRAHRYKTLNKRRCLRVNRNESQSNLKSFVHKRRTGALSEKYKKQKVRKWEKYELKQWNMNNSIEFFASNMRWNEEYRVILARNYFHSSRNISRIFTVQQDQKKSQLPSKLAVLSKISLSPNRPLKKRLNR